MKKLLFIAGICLILVSPAYSSPEITYTDFYQKNLETGEDIIFGVQFEGPADMSHATATLNRDGEEIGFSPLLDRNDDHFYSGSLGPVEDSGTYQVEIKGCNSKGDCTTEKFEREVTCPLGLDSTCL